MVYVQFDSVLGVFLHRERGYALATWGLVFAISPILVGLTQYPVARIAGRHSARAMLALGALLEGIALFILWPTSVLPVLVVSVVVVTLGEMILQPIAATVAAGLAPEQLRGSYEAVVGVAFAASWAPGVLAGLWLVGSGHGEVMLILALPISVLAALCFRTLPPCAA
jgi:MFS family permease